MLSSTPPRDEDDSGTRTSSADGVPWLTQSEMKTSPRPHTAVAVGLRMRVRDMAKTRETGTTGWPSLGASAEPDTNFGPVRARPAHADGEASPHWPRGACLSVRFLSTREEHTHPHAQNGFEDQDLDRVRMRVAATDN